MIIQLILTLGLVFCGAYALLQKKEARYLTVVIYAAVIVGIYFVWFPDHTTAIARTVGVGRGADLVLYVWILISIVIGFNLHVKLASQARRTTLLARRVAILTAQPETPLYFEKGRSQPRL